MYARGRSIRGGERGAPEALPPGGGRGQVGPSPGEVLVATQRAQVESLARGFHLGVTAQGVQRFRGVLAERLRTPGVETDASPGLEPEPGEDVEEAPMSH